MYFENIFINFPFIILFPLNAESHSDVYTNWYNSYCVPSVPRFLHLVTYVLPCSGQSAMPVKIRSDCLVFSRCRMKNAWEKKILEIVVSYRLVSQPFITLGWLMAGGYFSACHLWLGGETTEKNTFDWFACWDDDDELLKYTNQDQQREDSHI